MQAQQQDRAITWDTLAAMCGYATLTPLTHHEFKDETNTASQI